MRLLHLFHHYFILIKEREVKEMAVIYVALIVKGIRTYASVPAVIKPKVKELLEQLELNDLINED